MLWVSIWLSSFVVRVLSQSQDPEEVSMHPMMITALAHEVERERRFHLRRRMLARVAGISLWPRVS